jgi:hypothetical protein
MGLLDRSDWKAEWIGLDGGDNPDCLADAQWIWFPHESAQIAEAAVSIPAAPPAHEKLQ